MSKTEKALQARLLFEIARSKAFERGVPGGPGAEVWIGEFYDYWNRLERKVKSLEDAAAAEEQEDE